MVDPAALPDSQGLRPRFRNHGGFFCESSLLRHREARDYFQLKVFRW